MEIRLRRRWKGIYVFVKLVWAAFALLWMFVLLAEKLEEIEIVYHMPSPLAPLTELLISGKAEGSSPINHILGRISL